MSRRFRLFVALCFAMSACLAAYKLWGLGWAKMITADGPRWNVELQIEVTHTGTNAPRLRLSLPSKGPRNLEDERFVHDGWDLVLRTRRGERYALLTALEGSGGQIGYRFRTSTRPATNTEVEGGGLEPSELVPSDDVEIRRQATALTSQAAVPQTRVRALYDFVQDEIAPSTMVVGALEALRSHSGADGDRSRLFTAMARAVGIPTRLVHVASLSDGGSRPLRIRPEVLLDGRWTAVDPVRGRFAGASADELELGRGDDAIAQLEGSGEVHIVVTTRRESGLEAEIARRSRVAGAHWLERWSPLTLPPHTQSLWRLLLLLPLGALVISVGRNLVGVPTFGTFAPLLLALALHEASFLTGVLILGTVLCVGASARILLDRFRLLLVPRLSLLLTIVVATVLGLDFALQRMNSGTQLSVALLPMVIFTMTIERLSLMAGAEGWRETLKTLGGTTVMTVACYLVVKSAMVQRVALQFPELNLAVVGGLLLMGRYTGYRLSERLRFQADEAGEPPPAMGLEP